MKLFIIVFFSFIFNLKAGTLSFIGPCSSSPLLEKYFEDDSLSSVGELTLDVLDKFSVKYEGTQRGFNSIFGTPTGQEAMEIISASEMHAYGWCYSVNDFSPEVFPDEVIIQEGDQVKWWFGYARFKDGEWIEQCTPSFKRRSQQFCE